MSDRVPPMPPDSGHPHVHRKTSDILRGLQDGLAEHDRVTVGWLVGRLGTRAFGVIILLMALPNVIPQIPGMSTVFGLLIMLPAVQLALGLGQMWLPSYLAELTMPSSRVAAMLVLAIPWVEKMERMIKPRFEFLMMPPAENLIGGLVLLMGFILFLPIPGANFLPALACAFIAIGMLERDGLIIGAGIGIAVGSLVVLALVVAGLWHVVDSYLFVH